MRSEKGESERFKRAEEPIDFSPASTATDPEAAAQDTSEDHQTGRHGYTENASFSSEPLDLTDVQYSGLAEPKAVKEFDGDKDVESPPPKISDDEYEDPRSYTNLNELNKYFIVDNDGDSSSIESVKSEQLEHDHHNDLQSWGKKVGLTDHEIERGHLLLDSLDNTQNKPHGADAITLAILTLVANESHGNIPSKILRHGVMDVGKESPEVMVIEDLIDQYEQLREDCNLEPKTIRSAREYVKEVM